ncbi:DNA internalization-related competence protein ComEC/Rec2 [Bacillota bacterium]
MVSVEGKVLSVEDRGDYLRILLGPESWKSEGFSGSCRQKLIINLGFSIKGRSGNESGPGDMKNKLIGKRISIKGRLSLPAGARNPGLFNYKLYLKSRGILGIISAAESHLEIVGERFAPAAAPGKLKAHFASSLDQYMGADSKALLMGILFGDKTMIEEDIYESFQRNGCAHILSVSGIHVSIVYLYISRLFRNRRSPLGSAIALALLLFYAALAEFSPSVVRAVVMIAVHILSKHLHRRYDLLCCISFSALLMLIFNPFYLFNLGFQLSYLAVFTLAFTLPVAEAKIRKIEELGRFKPFVILMRIFTPIFVIQAGMAPATAYHFMYFSLSAFLINLPVIAISSLVVPAGICLAIISISPAADLFLGPGSVFIEIIMQIMIRLNQFAGSLSISSVNVISPSLFAGGLYYGFFFFLTSEGFWIMRQKRKKRIILLICTCIVAFSAMLPPIAGGNSRQGDIVFVDVGQGDCIHLRTPSGKNVLIDGGGQRDYDVGKKILMPYLLKNGVGDIDLALVTHLHQDHYGGIASLARLMPVHKLAVYEGNLLKEDMLTSNTGIAAENLLYVSAGDRISVDKYVYLDVLYPLKRSKEAYAEIMTDEKDENLSSLVVRVVYKGISVLVTGDMGFEGEKMLMECFRALDYKALKADFLKVGHHGSRFSTGRDFLDAVQPEAAVIQVGKNNFGHPHGDTIEMLSKKDIMIFRNDVQGAIILNIRKNGVSIRTML